MFHQTTVSGRRMKLDTFAGIEHLFHRFCIIHGMVDNIIVDILDFIKKIFLLFGTGHNVFYRLFQILRRLMNGCRIITEQRRFHLQHGLSALSILPIGIAFTQPEIFRMIVQYRIISRLEGVIGNIFKAEGELVILDTGKDTLIKFLFVPVQLIFRRGRIVGEFLVQ